MKMSQRDQKRAGVTGHGRGGLLGKAYKPMRSRTDLREGPSDPLLHPLETQPSQPTSVSHP